MGMPTATLAALALLLLCVSMSSLSNCLATQYKLGDALFFLYPPSQDSAVQVTAKAFAACDISGPLLKLEDGNSVFNLTKPGRAYFTSAAPGRCRKGQKLSLDVPGADEKMLKPSTDDSSGSAKSARMTSCAGSASSPTGSPFFVAPRMQSKGGELPTAGAHFSRNALKFKETVARDIDLQHRYAKTIRTKFMIN
ncbi:hypothetical protein VPH35_061389 [Triticum aestivum]|uniref:uclacyanin-3-like n=1 Tax=Triticum aestivum TaxID=4565 RepID=UPI001D0224BC|nr:uclacyanin-3-like [Triticum aestivum]